MFNPNPGEEIWVSSFYGPKQGVFQMVWPEKKKVLFELNGSPEFVELDDCFVLERDCYAAAAAKQRDAMSALKQAGEYSAKACGMKQSEAA